MQQECPAQPDFAYKAARYLSSHQLLLGISLTTAGISFMALARILGTIDTDAPYWFGILSKELFRPWSFLATPLLIAGVLSFAAGTLLLLS